MKHTVYILSAAAVLAVSCVRTELDPSGKTPVIRFTATEGVSDFLTKSEGASRAAEADTLVLTSEDGRTIRLVAVEEPLALQAQGISITKAPKVYGSTAADIQALDFAVWAYNLPPSAASPASWVLDGGTGSTPVQVAYDNTKGDWRPTGGDILHNTSSRDTGWKSCWFAVGPWGAYSGADAAVSGLSVVAGASPTLIYTVPSGKNVQKQWDLLAARTDPRDIANGNPVALTFAHVLTGIRFKRDAGLDISNILISGVYGSATLDMAKIPVDGDLSGFVHVDEGTTAGYYDPDNDLWSGRGTTGGTYEMDMAGSDWVSDVASKDANTLMMIPQLTPGGARITVTIDGFTYTGDISGHRWLPGRLVTYRIDKQPPFFSVSPTRKVRFAPGNVQYKASTQEWRFAENQWDYVGDATVGTVYENGIKSDNTLISSTYNGWIDLFGWATAGVKNPDGDYGYDSNHKKYHPYSPNSGNYLGFGPISGVSGMEYSFEGWTDLLLPIGAYDTNDTWIVDAGNTWNNTLVPGAEKVRKYCDWGVHFNESGEGSQNRVNGTWFTMSYSQQRYLFMERANAGLLSGYAVIHISPSVSVSGIVILPDNWGKPQTCSFVSQSEYDTGDNVYYAAGASPSQGPSGSWAEMEEAGAVFLPSAGIRYDSDDSIRRDHPAYQLSYWTSSFGGVGVIGSSAVITAYGWRLSLTEQYTPASNFNFVVKNCGCSVRLVHDVD